MKIYMLVDMEGISGIRRMEQVKRDSPGDYAVGCRLMTAEVNQAVDAVCAAGATEVVVCDTHGGGGQLDIADVDPRALYETPNAGLMMPSLDASFDGLILLGHHAKAGTLDGFLDHTMTSAEWFEYRINGKAVGEIAIEAAVAGHYGVPVIALGGDAALAAEAADLFGPEVPCAVVKWGIGRNRARCLPLPQGHAEIRRAITDGLGRVASLKPYTPSLPATIELVLYRSDMADAIARKPGNERVDARCIRRRIDSLLDVMAIKA